MDAFASRGREVVGLIRLHLHGTWSGRSAAGTIGRKSPAILPRPPSGGKGQVGQGGKIRFPRFQPSYKRSTRSLVSTTNNVPNR